MELTFSLITDYEIDHYTMEVSPSQTVLEIKEKFQELTGVPVFRQTIGFHTEILADGFILRHSDIVDGSGFSLDIRTDQWLYRPDTGAGNIQPPATTINQQPPVHPQNHPPYYLARYECPPISRFCENPPPYPARDGPPSSRFPQNPPPQPAYRIILRERRPRMRRASSFSPFFRSLVPLLFPSYTNFINQRNRQRTPEAGGGVEGSMEERRRIIRSGKRTLEDVAGPSGVAAGGDEEERAVGGTDDEERAAGGDEEEGAEGGPSPRRRQRVAVGGDDEGGNMEERRRMIRLGKRTLEDMAGPSGVAGGGDEEEGAEGEASPRRRQRVAVGGDDEEEGAEGGDEDEEEEEGAADSDDDEEEEDDPPPRIRQRTVYDWSRVREVEGTRRRAGTMVVVVEYKEERCMVEVWPDEPGWVLRERIEEMRFRGLPPNGYFFIHRQRVFDEIETFAWNQVEEGDNFQPFPGVIF